MKEEKKKILLMALEQFYLNKHMDKPLISDEEFDSLQKEWEETEGSSVKSLINWDAVEPTYRNESSLPFSKVVVKDNDIKGYLKRLYNNSCNITLNYKYDGSSIKAYYKRGRLFKILSTPDSDFGIDRTKSFWNLFPHRLEDESISSLRGEVLVDWKVYGELSRNKANGLTNSKLMDKEVESEAFIRIYGVQYHDNVGKYDYHRMRESLRSLPIITKERLRPVSPEMIPVYSLDVVFCSAPELGFENISNYASTDFMYDESFQIDGAVVYSEKEIKGYKFYYTESAITTVTEVHYSTKPNGSISSKLFFEPIVLNGKRIQAASTGGIPNLMAMKAGIGARVEVILSGLTIPKIVKVLEPSEDYRFPKCGCGYQMTVKDIFGSTFKCGNTEVCEHRLKLWSAPYENMVAINKSKELNLDFVGFFRKNLVSLLSLLKIDRVNFNSFDKGENENPIANILASSVVDNDFEMFKSIIDLNVRPMLSNLQRRLLDRNVRTTFEVYRRIFDLYVRHES